MIIAYSIENVKSYFMLAVMYKMSDTKKGRSGGSGKKLTQPKIKRLHTLDEIRGFAVFCMIFYHGFYSLAYLFDLSWGKDLLNFFAPAEPYFAGLFIVISGIASCLSHSNLERGGKLLLIALAVTIVTFFFDKNSIIVFGILHFLSICMILFGAVKPLIEKIPLLIVLILNIALFILCFNVPNGIFGTKGLFEYAIPTQYYTSNYMFAFGLPSLTFASADYFPLIPWMFLFFAGTAVGRLAARGRFPKFMEKQHIPFFSVMGKNALFLYIVHQPVILGICYLVQWIIGLFIKA